MADLKYFISESQRFRAGDSYVEGGMMVGGLVVMGAGVPLHLCTLLQQWAKRCPLQKTTKWYRVESLRLTGCVIKLSYVGSRVVLTIIFFFQTFVHLCKANTATI